MKKLGLIGLILVASLTISACKKATTTKQEAVRPNLSQFRFDLADRMITAQSADVDTIAGATDSTTGWKQAVSKAIDSAKGENNTLLDGTYKAEGEKRQFGYEDATIVIQNGTITSITLRRLNNDGSEVDYTQWTGK